MTEVQANVTTVIGQSAAGYITGNFVLIVSIILLIPKSTDAEAVLLVPLLLICGLLISVPAGLSISVISQLAHRPLNTVYRAAIGFVIVVLAWLVFAALFSWPPLELWALGSILVSGIGIGLVTGSRLRPWRELSRQGDLVGPVLRVFAAGSGIVLRVTVVFFFMVSCIALIIILQSSYYQRIDRIWSIAAFAHFTAALVVLFARIRIELLLPLAVIVNAPMVARVFIPPKFDELGSYVTIWYLALWATFLLTNWRQTPVAFSFLKEEFRYYLID